MAATARKTVTRAASPAPPPPVRVLSPPQVAQCAGALRVSSPHDAAEIEAERTAKQVMRMPEAAAAPSLLLAAGAAMRSPYVARMGSAIVQRAPAGPANAPAGVAAGIDAARSAGSPLPPSVRRFMEPRFGADFAGVRIHAGDQAAKLSRQLNARAFTIGNQIFFGRQRYQPDSSEGRELIAHELTHTIQQGAASQERGLQRSVEVAVNERSGSQVQRGWLPDPREIIAGKAAAIPGFTMFTVVIGFNPITNAKVDRSAGNILKGAIELIPGGSLITEALDNHGIFAKVSVWAQTQFDTIRNIGANIWNEVENFIKGLGVADLADPGNAWERAKRIVTAPIGQMIAFARNLRDGIVLLVKDAILRPIGAFARTTRGYPLLCSIMGKDPITGDPAPQDPEALMGAFMLFIGEQELWATMKKTNAVARTFAWFKGASAALKGFVAEIPGLFVAAFKSLEILDIVLIPRAFIKLGKVFGGFAGRFVSWGATAVWNLLEIIFDVVKPGVMGYIKRTGAALKGILRNPMPFVGNLVKAAKLGFMSFADNFGGHLKAGLIDWLTGSLAGVYIPKALTLPEMGKLALSVLGITWAGIRAKIVKVLGPTGETIMQGLEKTFDVVVTLATGGPAAAWNLIKEKLNDLKDTVVNGIKDFVTDTIVKKAIPKLIAMFIPGAGFVSAILTIYDTVMVFVQKISKIAQVAAAFIDSIVAIAGGAIAGAARRVESILGGLLSLSISLLAGFLGMGKVTDKVNAVVGKTRGSVDKAIDGAIAWIVAKAKTVFGKLIGKKDNDKRSPAEKQADLNRALKEAESLQRRPGITPSDIRKGLPAIKSLYKLTSLDLVVISKGKAQEKVRVKAKINPEGDSPITEVTDDVMQLVKDDFASAPEQMNSGTLNGLFDQAMAKRGPQGLRTLELQSQSKHIGKIVASASPATILGYVVLNRIPLPDYGAVTAVIALDDVPRGHFSNKKGVHAEEAIIGFAHKTIALEVKKGKVPKRVEILVSQSPCLHICQPQLNALRAAYRQTAFVLYYKTLHQSTSGEETEDSLTAIRRLRRGGWRVFIWNDGKIDSGIKRRR